MPSLNRQATFGPKHHRTPLQQSFAIAAARKFIAPADSVSCSALLRTLAQEPWCQIRRSNEVPSGCSFREEMQQRLQQQQQQLQQLRQEIRQLAQQLQRLQQ